MILLDENWPEGQRRAMADRGWRVRQAGDDWGRKGMSDEEILSVLQQKGRITLFTRDAGFYARSRCHERCCIVWMQVSRMECAEYAMRLLKHARFRTFADRRGKVIRVQPTGLNWWERNSTQERSLGWR